MEWNGREWVKRAEDDALSALPPLPQKPKPLPPSSLPNDLPSLSVDDVLRRLGLSAASPSAPSALRSSPTPSPFPPKAANVYSAGRAAAVSARYASTFDDFGFEAAGKAASPAPSPTIAAVLSPPPPDAADLSSSVFPSSPQVVGAEGDPRAMGRPLSAVLDSLDAANASIASLHQQLALHSALPRPLPTPAPDAADGEMELGHLRHSVRAMELEKVQHEMALAKAKEEAQTLQLRIEAMKAMEAEIIGEELGGEASDEAAMESEAGEEAMEAASLRLQMRQLRRKAQKLSAQLHIARQHLREGEQEKERLAGREGRGPRGRSKEEGGGDGGAAEGEGRNGAGEGGMERGEGSAQAATDDGAAAGEWNGAGGGGGVGVEGGGEGGGGGRGGGAATEGDSEGAGAQSQ